MKNIKVFKTLTSLAICLPVFMLASCGNKSKMTGKWQMTKVTLHSVEMENMLHQIYGAENNSYTGGEKKKQLEKMADSLSNIRHGIEDDFKKDIYEFKGDGTVEIQTSKETIKGTWDLHNGEEHATLYVDINKNGNLYERWQIYDHAFSFPEYDKDKKIYAKINNGGPFEKCPLYFEAEPQKVE